MEHCSRCGLDIRLVGRMHLCRSKPIPQEVVDLPEPRPAVRPFKNGKSYAPGTTLYDHQCVWCGAEFRGSYDKTYCSTRCRVAGWRAKKRGIKVNISDTRLISWGQRRFAVLERDGFKCRYCGRGAKQNVVLHIDHVIPKVAGGSNKMENLMTACQTCNLGKGAATIKNLPE